MTRLSRLVFDGIAALFLLASLAYWWLGNLAHKLLGTALFVLLIRHNLLNRRWYSMLRRGRFDLRRRFGTLLTLGLTALMLLLLISSIAISRSVFGFLSLPVNYTLGDLHRVAAYWAIVIVGAHIGLHWPHVMMSLRRALCLGDNSARRWALRGLAFVLALWGLRAADVMDLGTKLSFGVSLDMWDFNADTSLFFAHWAAILALIATLTHLGLTVLETWRARPLDMPRLGQKTKQNQGD